jgi:acyl-CoA thioester hydrolase
MTNRASQIPPHAHLYELRVRWSDVDAYGHVNNVLYFEYFQEARISFLAGLTDGADAISLANGFVLARLVVDYRRPILFRSAAYEIATWPTRLGRSSFDLHARIHDGHTLLASSQAVLVGFDGAGQRARPLDETERAGLETRLVRG